MRCPVSTLRARWGLRHGEPQVVADSAVADLRRLGLDVRDEVIAGSTDYTIAFARPGAAVAAARLAAAPARSG